MSSFLSRHRTICEVLQEIQKQAELIGDEKIMDLVDEARDYAQRMSARLVEYKIKEEGQ